MSLDKSINHYGFIYFHGSKNIYSHWIDIFIALVKAMVLPVVMYGCAATAAAKSLQSCPTLCDPIDCSPQAPPSLGFSRQEHWSGLPFPSPMHGSEK